ncbi:hypothetical protein [Rubritalea marina]|uniref:hypothetical protein n=1 Tax=Rubritalea marina TaxID=361055 RepID=UPI0012EA9B8D|nr:hypothetical protein [Rubritalea marina]
MILAQAPRLKSLFQPRSSFPHGSLSHTFWLAMTPQLVRLSATISPELGTSPHQDGPLMPEDEKDLSHQCLTKIALSPRKFSSLIVNTAAAWQAQLESAEKCFNNPNHFLILGRRTSV